MRNGFSEVVDKILRRYGLKTRDCVGTYWGNGEENWTNLLAMGYRIEKGIINPDYDYVIISKENSTLENILLALTKIKVGCIIIFRADGEVKSVNTWHSFSKLGNFYIYEYGNNKILGVIFKGKEE